jgi:hypothetical protein
MTNDLLYKSSSTVQDLNLHSSTNYGCNKLEIVVPNLNDLFQKREDEGEGEVTHGKYFGENISRVIKAFKNSNG